MESSKDMKTNTLESTINRVIDECIEKNILKDILTTRRADVIDAILFEISQESKLK